MENLINQITNINCLTGFKCLKDSSIDLIVTSPPYNLNINYDSYNDSQSLKSYIKFLNKVAKEMFRVVKDDGRVCINIPIDANIDPSDPKKKIDVSFIVKQIFYGNNFKYRNQIFWDKNNISNPNKRGSWYSASNPNILLPFEIILVFYKNSKGKSKKPHLKDITRDDFLLYTNGHWNLPGSKPPKNKTCPVPFPTTLPKRLIQLFSYENDLVLDPFCGNGTTCVVAAQLKRNFIGFELSSNYCNEAQRKLRYMHFKV